MDSQLRARAEALGLRETEVAEWEASVDDELVAALLGGLVAFEDALKELAA